MQRLRRSMNKENSRLSPEIKRKRKKIDRVDQQILALFNQRIRLVAETKAVKKRMGKKFRDLKREKELLERLKERNKGPLKEEELEKIFRAILGMCRRCQK
jgi:chorismate mutase